MSPPWCQVNGQFPGPADMPAAFLDPIFNESLPDLEKIEAEDKMDIQQSELDSVIEEASSDTESIHTGDGV